ncbi:MAG TPA: archaemetzincin family Zn-dependent metalloprotease [candidate division Zixibacteria bacterium]
MEWLIKAEREMIEKKAVSTKSKIVVIPLGDVDYGIVNKLATNLVSIFNAAVDILQGIRIPQEAYNQQRGQYYSTVILNKLDLLRANPREKILGVIDEDLYVPSLNFVFGEANPLSKVAVISLFRLKQENYDATDEEGLYFSRLSKEAVHELGHLIGFKHCPNPRCVMYFSNSLLETDRKNEKFCDNCLRKARVEGSLV